MDEEGLAIVCSTLGTFEENGHRQDVYVKHPECLESLKDLQRYMRRDHPERRDVFMQLGKWNIVRRDIAPLIVRYSDDHELVLTCVKVLVFLTMPIDPSSHQVSLQIEYLQHFRAALVDNETIPVIMSLLEEPLQNLERGAQKEDDWKMLQLFLALLRNLLAIPDSFTHHISASTQYAFMKERLLEILFNESVMDLVVALTQHTAGRHGGLRQDNHLILEILHHVLMSQRPEVVAAATDKHFKVQKQSEKSSVTLRALMHEEKAQLKSTRYDPALHTPFSGMFVRVAGDGTKTILTRTPHQSPLENLLRKPQTKRGPVKRVVPENTAVRPTNDHLQVLLKDFVNQFLASGYNVLMQTIKDDLRRERPDREAVDPVPFFQVVQFFTAYLCCIAQKDQGKYKQPTSSLQIGESEMSSQKHICGLIASTMDEEMFVLVRSKWCHYIDEAQTTKNWVPVAAGVAVMKDMIHMLDIVLKRPGPIDKQAALELRTARILLYKVFYDQTETGVIQTVISLLRSFDIHKQPRSFLADLVEIAHIVLRLLEAATKEGTLRVLKKVRGGRKKARVATSMANETVAGATDVEVPVETDGSQRDMGRPCVVRSDLGQESGDTVGIENESTDDLGLSKESPKAVVQNHTDNLTGVNPENLAEKVVEVGQKSADVVEDDEDDDEPETLTKEVTLDVKELVVRRFADNTIVRNYCWLLKYYSTNSATTNYYVVRMLQRICEDRVLEPMLYQLSIFQTFYAILSDKQLSKTKDDMFVVAFLTKVVRGFFKKLKSQPMLFIELLFWKLKHECANISADYMIHNLKRAVSASSKGRQRVNIADALGDDEDFAPHSRADAGNDGLGADSDETHLSGDDDQLESLSSAECSLLSESEQSQLKELFQKYKDENDCAHLISQELDPSAGITAEQVKSNLRLLGLLEPHVGKVKRRTTNDAVSYDRRKLGPGESRKLKRSVDSTDAAASNKRKKSSLFTTSQDEKLGELFLRLGNSRKCSKTIAESFGGEFTPAQVSRRLRTLGLLKQKPKSKLETFLASVRDSEEDGGSDQEAVGEIAARNKPSSSNKISSLDQMCDTEDDDDAPLGSLFRTAACPGEASTSGNQDLQQPNAEASRLDLRATIGRGARHKAYSLTGKEKFESYHSDGNLNLDPGSQKTRLLHEGSSARTSTSKSGVTEMVDLIEETLDEYTHDNRVPEDGLSIRKDEGTSFVGSLVKEPTGSASEQPPSSPQEPASGLHASWGARVRKRPHTGDNHENDALLTSDARAEELPSSLSPNASRRSRGELFEETATAGYMLGNPEMHTQNQATPSVNPSDANGRESDNCGRMRQREEFADVELPDYTTGASLLGEDDGPFDWATAGESFQLKTTKRRRLAKKMARFQVLEVEGQEVAGKSSGQELAHQQQVLCEETSGEDGLNDY